MADPVLHLIAGPNGAGKSTLYDRVIGPVSRLERVNADVITARMSFVTETVFSHESKVDLVKATAEAGYLVTLHVVLVPEDLAVAAWPTRVETDGHDVPEQKVRSRYARLWSLVAEAIALVDEATVYDNSSASEPFRVVASFDRGAAVSKPAWPRWTPKELRDLA